jgi:hypothetical protein
VLDLQPVELRHVVDVGQVRHARVGGRHAQDLVVAALLVGHPEHPDRPAADQAARERRFVEQHEYVERVLVLAQGAVDEPVVGGVPRGREQHPIEPDAPGHVVHLVLVTSALRYLDGHVEFHAGALSRSD